MQKIVAVTIGIALSLGTLAAAAQEGADRAPDSAAGSQESRKLLEDVLMARLTRELALDETQTVLLMRHLAELRDRMTALRRERAEKLRELRQAVRESKDEEKIGALLDEVLALNQKQAAARDGVIHFDGFELTTWQQARLLLFLNDFEGDMNRLLRRAQERRAAGLRERPGPRERGPDSEAAEGDAGGDLAGGETPP